MRADIETQLAGIAAERAQVQANLCRLEGAEAVCRHLLARLDEREAQEAVALMAARSETQPACEARERIQNRLDAMAALSEAEAKAAVARPLSEDEIAEAARIRRLLDAS